MFVIKKGVRVRPLVSIKAKGIPGKPSGNVDETLRSVELNQNTIFVNRLSKECISRMAKDIKQELSGNYKADAQFAKRQCMHAAITTTTNISTATTTK